MAFFPKIQSPCPYKGQLSAIMDGEMCRLCKREVFDLTDMSDAARMAFMKGCSGEVCVTYRLRPAVAAAAIAVATLATPMAAAACDATSEVVVLTGGIKDTANVKFVENPADKAVPELPVVYESKQPAPATPAKNATAKL